MNFRILSDLHFEYHPDAGQGFVDAMDAGPEEVLILAGNLATPCVLAQSLALLCARFRHVLFVAGPTEYCGATPTEVHDILRAAAARHQNLHWLDCSSVCIEGQRFVGATPWFDQHPRYAPGHGFQDEVALANRLRPWVTSEHARAVAYLNEAVAADDVVVTHHPSTFKLGVPIVLALALICFNEFEMTSLILARQPRLWVHCHPRDGTIPRFGETRIIANSFGYRGQEERAGFQPNLRIELCPRGRDFEAAPQSPESRAELALNDARTRQLARLQERGLWPIDRRH